MKKWNVLFILLVFTIVGVASATYLCPAPCDHDDDLDWVCDFPDNCDGIYNPVQNVIGVIKQPDSDNDGLGNACDPDDDNDGISDTTDSDDDNDGILDTTDNCPGVSNGGQADCWWESSVRYGEPEGQCDGIGYRCDNCRDVFNPNQADNDLDGIGDACDPDDDNDGVADGSDNCPLDCNPDQGDWCVSVGVPVPEFPTLAVSVGLLGVFAAVVLILRR